MQGHQLAFDGLPCQVAGLVPPDDYQAACDQHLHRNEVLRNARFMNLALLAAAEALQVSRPTMLSRWWCSAVAAAACACT